MAATLAQLATLLKASPKSFNALTSQQKADMLDALRPLSGFDASQRSWFEDWWFVCTQAQVDAINALLPASVRVDPTSFGGALYLSTDLATDCANQKDTYFAARSVIRTLVCANVRVTSNRSDP